jgi:hypothetical protein
MDNSEPNEKGGEFDEEGFDEEIDELDSQDNHPGWENAERYVAGSSRGSSVVQLEGTDLDLEVEKQKNREEAAALAAMLIPA